jgi:ribosome-associated protein
MSEPLRVDARTVIPAGELAFSAVRSSGPGGQNVNKVASKVELRFDLPGSSALRPEVKARLRALAGKRVDADGRLRLVSQRTRDQARNRQDVLDRLAALIREALIPPRPRKRTRPTRASKTRRVQDKRAQAGKKRLRGRVGAEDW